jgi:hypothetical protein
MRTALSPWLSVVLLMPATSTGQQAILRPAPPAVIPFPVDGNSPLLWQDGRLTLFTSTGRPVLAEGFDALSLNSPVPVRVRGARGRQVWIESVWREQDGTILGWYHEEPQGLCPGTGLTAPQIGALVSYDGGRTFTDLGIILTSGAPVDCRAKNNFFGGGNGDFSVVFDQGSGYFYFLFTHYGGDVSEQGVAAARLPFEARYNPRGAVQKYYQGEWREPGLGGRLTPVFGANEAWQRSEPDSFWGPAVHWNTHLLSWVAVMNRACCDPEWRQQGIYISYNPDLARPELWSQPRRILAGHEIGYRPGFYPQVIGLGEGETDTLVGKTGRFYIHGQSKWEIVFERPGEYEEDPVEPPPGLIGPEMPVDWDHRVVK